MNESWMDKRNYLARLIKKVSDEYGGDEPEWLKEYGLEIIESYSGNLDEAITCFESLQDIYKK